MKKIKLKKQLHDELYCKFQRGLNTPKKPIKDIHNSTPYIHSRSTYDTYLKQCNAFADWTVSKYGQMNMNNAFKHIPEYLQECEIKGQSAWTIQTKLNAIAKAFGVSTMDIDYNAPKRHRADVKRSRGIAVRDKGFNLNNPENQLQNALGRAFGLRRAELDAIHWEDLVKRNGKLYMKIVKHNGKCAAKGGRERMIECQATPEELKIIEKAYRHCGGQGKCVAKIHSHLDEHANRAIYACRIYKFYAREEIPKHEKYACRRDKAGIVYDKNAMRITSQNLGHKRIDVIANSYLHNL